MISLKFKILIGVILLISACAPRAIVLDGIQYSEEYHGKFLSWVCRDAYGGKKVLVELGIFTDPSLHEQGFVLFDGNNTGKMTHYQRKGVNHRWDWGPTQGDYCFVIQPEGIGLFYDFSSISKGESRKADSVYRCFQR